MSEFLDWVTQNSWAVALAGVTFAVVGYALTRPAAVHGRDTDDSSAWVIFCMALYPDTRRDRDDDVSDDRDEDTGGAGGGD